MDPSTVFLMLCPQWGNLQALWLNHAGGKRCCGAPGATFVPSAEAVLIATCHSSEKSKHSYYCKLLRNLFSPPSSCLASCSHLRIFTRFDPQTSRKVLFVLSRQSFDVLFSDVLVRAAKSYLYFLLLHSGIFQIN